MTTNGDGREAGRGAGRGSAPTTGMRIGEFAGLTGLSVRALRWYDAEGVLVPRVDPASGHRRYLLTQLDHAVLIRTLRDAGVPLPEIRAVLTGDPDATPGAALAATRAETLARRGREDAAHARALAALTLRDATWDIREEHIPARPFMATTATLPMPDIGDEAALADANETIMGLLGLLLAGETGVPTGPGDAWLTFGSGPDDDQVTVTVARSVPPGEAVGARVNGRVTTGTLPAHRALTLDRVVRADEPDLLVDPAMVALLGEAASRDLAVTTTAIREHLPVPLGGATGGADPDGGAPVGDGPAECVPIERYRVRLELPIVRG